MLDVALASAGAQLTIATSSDEIHRPENIIDGKPDTFWTTTGLFPQEFVITFQGLVNLNAIKLECCSVKGLRIEKSVANNPIDFEPLDEKELGNANDLMQTESISVSNVNAKHLKFIIDSAYDHFCSVHRVSVNGNAVHN